MRPAFFLGGTLIPVHNGHLLLAKTGKEQRFGQSCWCLLLSRRINPESVFNI